MAFILMKRILAFLFLFIALKVSAAEETRFVQVFMTAASVAGRDPATAIIKTNVYVQGMNSAGDGHAGLFTYYSGSSAATNLYNCFKPSSGVGRWIRELDSPLTSGVIITNVPAGGTGELVFGNSAGASDKKKARQKMTSTGFTLDFINDDDVTVRNMAFFPQGGGMVISSGSLQQNGVIAAAETIVGNLTITGTTAAQYHTIAGDATAGAITVTLPPVAQAVGHIFYISKIDATVNAVTIKGDSSDLISGVNTKVINSQWTGYMVQNVEGTFWLVL